MQNSQKNRCHRPPSAVDLSHDAIGRYITPGATVIDATAGNGHDTLFLARQVGSGGRVIAFDVQEIALDATRHLIETGLAGAERPALVLCKESHARLADALLAIDPQVDLIGAAMFNLGYLPRGDKSIVTRPESTVAALTQAFDILLPGGIISIVLYLGHPGGRDEAEAVIAWAKNLAPEQAQTSHWQPFLNRENEATRSDQNPPPELITIWRRITG